MSLDVEIATFRLVDFVPIIRLYETETGRLLDRQLVRTHLTSHPCATAFIACRLVGFLYTRQAAPDLLEIDNLYVTHQFRQNGIGSALLLRIEAEAAQYNAIMAINSLLYEYRFARRSAGSFYIRNGFGEIWSNGLTSVYVKTIR